MKDGICHIVSAGDFSIALLPPRESLSLLIAADAGYRVLRKAGVEPDVFVGDGDSLGFIPDHADKVILPCKKDDTDTHAAIKLGFERGYRRFAIYGALGGKRFSHSLANLQCLSFISDLGGEGVIVDENCTVRLISEGETYRFEGTDGYFSLFSWEGEAIVSVTGAKYETERAAIPAAATLGVSNEPRGECTVTVHSGRVLLVRDF